ncbi:MAG: hypothetical protein K8L91_14035 [Anaerolineae bacterium]|nr:hypothetical protein [Anaerolineae bacterium]
MQHDVSNKKSAQTWWVGFTYLATSGNTGFVLSYWRLKSGEVIITPP